MNEYEVIVIGAGPAGMLAAGRAAMKGAKVLVLEKMDKPGRKLLITGKGRCNITNSAGISDFIKQTYPNGRFLKYAFSQFFNKDIINLINEQGVETEEGRGGRLFPTSNKSGDVLNALLNWTKKYKVEYLFGHQVKEFKTEEGRIVEIISEKQNTIHKFYAKGIILSTGGKSYPATGSTGDGYALSKAVGHTIVSPRPALVPIETTGNIAQQAQGLTLKNARAIVWINGKKLYEEFGELVFTHFGLSGPIILTLSRFIVDAVDSGKKVEVSIDLKPALDEQKLDTRLLRDLNDYGKKHVINLFKLWLPQKLIPIFINLTGIDPQKEAHQISAKERKKIKLLLKDFRFTISGYRSFKEAIITAGGVCVSEIEQKTMRSKLIENLYFAGEIIDLDANTGGYNLQIAYSTGWLAGESVNN